ncbi:MAG: MBL fold metallo-hydrolase [Bdellovibrionaceae bacterium]|nr:MBL fold metallo-hydrolase [Pseudobdellovibrionaceae bacterium]
MQKPTVKEFFDTSTWTLTYIVFDPTTKDAVIIDPVWDYDAASSKVSSQSTDKIVSFIKESQLKVHYILETHAHADHITGSQVLKKQLPGAKVGIGAPIIAVQKVFKDVFNLDENFKTDGSQFDLLLEEGVPLQAGSLRVETLYTPGHTPACATFVIGDSVFTGDALFMPDYGTGRCDFPSGSSEDLYDSVYKRIYALPDQYRVFVGHDYLPDQRPLAFESTIAEEKKRNIQLNIETKKADFVELRNKRDRSLAAPKLLFPSVQININAGCLPTPDNKGTRYLKIPIR